MSDFPQSTWWENSRVFFPKSSIYPPYRLYIGSKVQWSVLDFVFFFKLVTFSVMCSPIKTFFKTIFSKQSVWNCFDIVMQWSPSKFSSEIAGTSWQHKQSMSLFPFQNASKYTNLYVQSCLSRHYWEKLFLPLITVASTWSTCIFFRVITIRMQIAIIQSAPIFRDSPGFWCAVLVSRVESICPGF